MPDVTEITQRIADCSVHKVNGTNVYNPAGDKLGSVEDIMLDKISGERFTRSCRLVASWG